MGVEEPVEPLVVGVSKPFRDHQIERTTDQFRGVPAQESLDGGVGEHHLASGIARQHGVGQGFEQQAEVKLSRRHEIPRPESS